jgi:hypothetical protein
MVKRVTSVFTALILSIITVLATFSGVTPAAYAATKNVSVKFHYFREDGNYAGWDVWNWYEGKDGSAASFKSQTDENGAAVAEVTVPAGVENLGYIVRTADWTKDIAKDQFVDLSDVVGSEYNVYIHSGVEGYTESFNPVDEGKINIRMHYQRQDGAYKDWDVWTWYDGADGSAASFMEKKDENGLAVANITVPENTKKVGFIIRKPDWSSKDVDKDQFVTLDNVKTPEYNIYVYSGIPGYTEKYGKIATRAQALDSKTVEVELVMPLSEKENKDTAFEIVNTAGNKYEIADVQEEGCIYKITLKTELNLRFPTYVYYNGSKCLIKTDDFYSSDAFESQYTYTGNDLGATYSKDRTIFKLGRLQLLM